MFLKIICYVLFMNSIGLIDAASRLQRCDYVTLPHGKVKYFNRARKVKFTCFKPFTLIGNSRLDCENGEWNGPIPICASKSCTDIPNFLHGKVTYLNDKAVARLECDTDFTLIGSPNVVCEASGWNNAGQWNYTEIPECQANSIRQFHPCDYEPDDQKQCKWISKQGLFNWTVMSSNPKDNIHMPVGTFPAHDHTLGLNPTGHFLYLEALYAPTKTWLDLMNTRVAPAKYMSPLFPPIVEDEAHCLIFYLYANGSYPGIVEVFSNQDSIWKSNGSVGIEWNRIKIPLHKRTTQFRITIEGKGELGQYTRTAIDDLRIAIGEECLEFRKTEEEVHVTQTSTYAGETTTMLTTDNTGTVTTILETEPSTEQPDQFTTQQPESQVVDAETTSPPWTLLDHIRHTAHLLAANRSRTNITGTPSWNSVERFNFAANSLAAPTNHNKTTSNTTNHNGESEGTNTSSKTKYTLAPNGEIVITENNLVYHENSAENKANDIIVEQDVSANSKFDHETDNESHIKSSATNLSSNESPIEEKARDEKEKQALSDDLTMLKNLYLPKDFKEVTNKPVTKETHLISILNTTVELNDAKDKQDHKEDENEQEVKDIGNNLRHSGNRKVTHLQTKYVENNEHEIENYSSHLNRSSNSIDSKMIWVISLLIICVLLMLFVVHGYKKYYFRNRRKDESSIRFIKKDDGIAGSPHKKDDILMLDCIPKKTV